MTKIKRVSIGLVLILIVGFLSTQILSWREAISTAEITNVFQVIEQAVREKKFKEVGRYLSSDFSARNEFGVLADQASGSPGSLSQLSFYFEGLGSFQQRAPATIGLGNTITYFPIGSYKRGLMYGFIPLKVYVGSYFEFINEDGSWKFTGKAGIRAL